VQGGGELPVDKPIERRMPATPKLKLDGLETVLQMFVGSEVLHWAKDSYHELKMNARTVDSDCEYGSPSRMQRRNKASEPVLQILTPPECHADAAELRTSGPVVCSSQ
jgi:hypothetical protein